MATKASSSSAKKTSPIIPIAIGCFVLLVLAGTGISFVIGHIAKKAGNGLLKGYVETASGGKVKLSDIEKGNMTFTDKETGKTVSVGASQKIPDDFPKDFPIYTNAKVVGSIAGMQDGKSGFLVTFNTDASVDQVGSFYKTALASSGWTTTGTYSADKMQTMAIKKADMEGSVSISSDDSATVILVTLGSKAQ
jgi:hypothetical protein